MFSYSTDGRYIFHMFSYAWVVSGPVLMAGFAQNISDLMNMWQLFHIIPKEGFNPISPCGTRNKEKHVVERDRLLIEFCFCFCFCLNVCLFCFVLFISSLFEACRGASYSHFRDSAEEYYPRMTPSWATNSNFILDRYTNTLSLL